jgi:hypothetical protein
MAAATERVYQVQREVQTTRVEIIEATRPVAQILPVEVAEALHPAIQETRVVATEVSHQPDRAQA